MHVHQSLFKGDKNAFFDADAPHYLSDVAGSFVEGILKYIPEFCLITNQWWNSYKRLVPGYEAPVYLSWARRNRSDLIRVPDHKPGAENAVRIEYRGADPACNPYLVFAAMLAAGLMRGLYNASRDILVRRAAPEGSSGTAFAFVTVGYSVGLSIAPVVFGWLLDQGSAAMVFYLSAAFALLAIVTVMVPATTKSHT